MKISPLMLILVGAAIWTLGDFFIQFWAENHKTSFFVIGFLIWTVGVFLLAISVLHKNLAVASTMMMAVNTIAFVIISWLVFKQTLNVGQMVGILFGLIGLYLLEVS